MSRISLLWKLGLTIGGLLLIVVGVLVTVANLEVERTAREAAEARLELTAAEVAKLLVGAVQRLLPATLERATDPRVQAYLVTDDPEKRSAALDALRYAGPRPELVLAVELLDPQGRRLLTTDPRNAAEPRIPLPELTGAARAGPIVAVDGGAAFPVLASVPADSAPLGVVVVWWRLDVTLRLVDAQAYIGNPDDGTWTDLQTFVAPPVADLDRHPQVIWYERAGSGWIAATSPVSGTPWVLLVETPQQTVLAPVHRFLRRLSLLAALLLGIGLAAVWFLSRRLVAPLNRLTAAADTISAGEYSARIGETGDDELGRLAAAFDAMAGSVQTAHRSIEEQATQYQLLFECNPSPMWVFDRDSLSFLAVNAAATRHYGYSREEFLALTIADIRPESEVPGLLRDLDERHQGLDLSGVWSHRKRDGTVIAVEITSHELEFGGRDAALVLARDVTARRRADEALRTAHETLRAIVEAAPVGIYSLDASGLVRSWNPAAERIFGWTAGEVLGQALPTVPVEARLEPVERLQQVASGQLLEGAELVRNRKDGSKVHVRLYAGPLFDALGEISGIMVVATDISDLRRLELQYRQAQKMEAVGRLAGGVAHDFNNLLTVILGESDLAMLELPDGDPARPALEAIARAGHAAAELTQRLLAFSRQQVVERTVFSFNDLVADLESMLRRLLGEDVTLVTRLEPGAGSVHADRNQFEQLLLNLAVNARDAMPDGGLLTLETTRRTHAEPGVPRAEGMAHGEYVLLSVSDSGTGMSEEILSHIFEPFFTTKGPDRGTGLGLAMCYGIVRQAGGHIEVYSEPGLGTTFRVYVPSADDATTRHVAAASSHRAGGSERILLVEDQDGVRRVATRMLESLGYGVLAVGDAEAALGILEDPSQPFDLLLTDVVLPGMKGSELADRARVLRPGLRVIFASGYTSDVAAHQKLVDGDAVLIQKPFTAAHLGERVRDVLDSPREGVPWSP